MIEDYPGIPYGYENVLPISQRYQQNPYAMSMTGTEGTRYIPYTRHYMPRLVYFLPHFSLQFITKSGFKSKAGYNGACTVFYVL